MDGGRLVADDTPAALKARIAGDVIQLALEADGRARARRGDRPRDARDPRADRRRGGAPRHRRRGRGRRRAAPARARRGGPAPGLRVRPPAVARRRVPHPHRPLAARGGRGHARTRRAPRRRPWPPRPSSSSSARCASCCATPCGWSSGSPSRSSTSCCSARCSRACRGGGLGGDDSWRIFVPGPAHAAGHLRRRLRRLRDHPGAARGRHRAPARDARAAALAHPRPHAGQHGDDRRPGDGARRRRDPVRPRSVVGRRRSPRSSSSACWRSGSPPRRTRWG